MSTNQGVIGFPRIRPYDVFGFRRHGSSTDSRRSIWTESQRWQPKMGHNPGRQVILWLSFIALGSHFVFTLNIRTDRHQAAPFGGV